MTPDRLLEALEAWNTHDADRVVAYFAEDCEYHASVGPDALGASYVGRDEVRRGVQRFFDAFPDGSFQDTVVTVHGTTGFAEWTFVSTDAQGAPVAVRGCDLLAFDGALLTRKNAFRKVAG